MFWSFHRLLSSHILSPLSLTEKAVRIVPVSKQTTLKPDTVSKPAAGSLLRLACAGVWRQVKAAPSPAATHQHMRGTAGAEQSKREVCQRHQNQRKPLCIFRPLVC